MTFFEILKRFKGKEMPRQLRRKAWKLNEICYCNGNYFYSTGTIEERFDFEVADLNAEDWEYEEKVWVSK